MDQFYFEEGYVEASYFGYLASASSSVAVTAGVSVQGDIASTTGYYIPDYIVTDYFQSGLTVGNAVLVASFTSSSLVNKTVNADAVFIVTFSQSGTISHIEGADLFAFSNAAIAVQVSRLRDNNIAASAVFSVAVDVVRIRSSAGDDFAEFSFTANTVLARSRDYASSQSAAFSLPDVPAVKTARTSSSQTSQFTQTAQAGKAVVAGANLLFHASVFVSRQIAELRPRNLPVTVSGSTYYDATNKKFGTHSLRSDSSLNFDRRLGGAAGSPNNITIANGESFVLETWIKLSTSQSSQAFVRLTGIQVHLITSGLKFQGGVLANDGTYAILSNEISNSFSNPSLFNHLLAVSDGTRISFYVNGTRQFTSTALPSTYWNGGVYIFGYEYNFDELSFHKGTTLGYNPSSTTITVPTTARTNNNTYTQGLWHFDNNALDDFTATAITHSGNANLTSVSSVSATVGFITNGQANLSVSSSVVAVIGTLETTNLFAFGDAAVITNANRLRGSNADCSASAAISATAFRIHPGASAVAVAATLVSTPNRLRDTAIALSSTATVNAIVNVQRSGSANVSANATVTAVIGRLNEINLVAFADGTITANAIKNTVGQSAITGVFTQLTSAVKTATTASAITSTNSLTVINTRTRNAGADFAVLGSTVTVVTELQGLIANLSSRFFTAHIYIDDDYLASGYYEQFETTAQKTASGSAALQSVATLTVGITASVFAALSTTSQASVNATVVKTVTVSIAQASASSVSASVRRIAEGIAAHTAVFTVFCNGVTAGEINMVAFANANVSATATANKPFNAVLSSQAIFFAYTQDSLNKVGEAHISSEFTTNIVAVKQVNAVIVTEAVASSLSVVVKTVAVLIPLDCNFSQTVTASRIRPGSSSQSVIATVSTTAVLTATAQAAITAQSTVAISGTKVVSAVIVTQAVASTLTANIRIAGLFIDCAVTSTVSATARVTRQAVATIASQSTLTVAIVKLVNASAGITSTGSVSATVGVRKPFTAAITSALTFVVAVRELRLDAIVYVIPAEGWSYRIEGETRLHTIISESRVKEIVGETRLHTINGESRIHII